MMVKFHWTLDEIKTLPISSFIAINQLMEWESKEIERGRK